MPIRVSWFDHARTTVCLIYQGRWTWDEYYAAHDRAYALIDAIGEPVYLYHITNETPIPAGALPHIKRAAVQSASRVKHTIIIGDDMFTRAMYQMFRKFAGEVASNHILVASLDAARQFRLQRNRSRVRNL